MAYNESGELSPSQSYQLGGYTFQLRSNYDSDEEVTGIVARMTYNGETKVQGIDIDGQVTIESWSVEANETEASVYCTIEKHKRDKGTATDKLYPGVTVPISNSANYSSGIHDLMAYGTTFLCAASIGIYGCSKVPGSFTAQSWAYPGPQVHTYSRNMNTRYEVNGKPVYYNNTGAVYDTVTNPKRSSIDNVLILCYIALYGDFTPEEKEESSEELIGRFEIDLETAGGGPDGDWDEPGDTGDPSYTLNVSVTGASAGTHNSENVPLDGEIQSVYGSGGNGGNGGGGGAGASTVIIYEFATDKAGSVNQEAYAREAGAGGPGGPGGRGADGCIIIFY